MPGHEGEARGLALLPAGTELRIAARYLFRRRHNPAWLLLTALFGVLAAACLALYFLAPGHQGPMWGGLAIVSPLIFVSALLINFFSVFSTVAVVGVLLGVASLTVVMAVTSGFQREVEKRVIGVNAHVVVLKYGTDFHEYEDILRRVSEDPEAKAAAPFVFNEMLVSREGGTTAGVIVKGIDVARGGKVLDIEHWLEPLPGDGRPPLTALKVERVPNEGGPPLPGAFIGKELQRKLKVKIGDRLRLVAPPLGMDGSIIEGMDENHPPPPPRAMEVRVAGVFTAGFIEYDQRLIFVELSRGQQLLGQGDVVTGVEMVVHDPDRAARVAEHLEKRLGGLPFRIWDWAALNHNLFTALALQKAVLGLVLFLIVLVAAFNIVASLTMMVIDKTRQVAILKAMGMSSGGVASVFRIAGMIIGLCGVVLGVGMGLLVCAVVQRLGYLLDAKVYLIERLPIRISLVEVVGTGLLTLLICFGATLYPSLRAARLPPVDGLRHE